MSTSTVPSKKTSCPVSRQEFRQGGKPISINLNGKSGSVSVKEFSTGSLGWYMNDKIDVEIGGKMVKVQVGLNMTIVGSKELPQG